jgi:predicted RNA-binding Zn-ribbon protein involved in translation (DUF1610 family)
MYFVKTSLRSGSVSAGVIQRSSSSDKVISGNKLVTDMICPKCGTKNDDGILFCENCDWRMDIPYVPEKEKGEKAKIFAPVTFVLGILAAALVMFQPIASIALGGVGLLLGGYSFNTSRVYDAPSRNMYIAISAIGLLLSMVAFILGFSRF